MTFEEPGRQRASPLTHSLNYDSVLLAAGGGFNEVTMMNYIRRYFLAFTIVIYDSFFLGMWRYWILILNGILHNIPSVDSSLDILFISPTGVMCIVTSTPLVYKRLGRGDCCS
jgi:hypothetical protein